MAALVISGDTSGTVTLAAPAIAGTQTYTLPTAVPASNGQVLSATTAGVMSWAAAGGNTFPTTIGVGGVSGGGSGAGIAFPATQSSSSDANTLDDYEEGSWTATIAGSTTTGTASYTYQSAYYTKIGRFVSCYWAVQYGSGTGTGNMMIPNLPFTSNNFGVVIPMIIDGLSVTAGSQVTGYTTGNVAYIMQIPSGGGTTTNVPYDSSVPQMILRIIYETST